VNCYDGDEIWSASPAILAEHVDKRATTPPSSANFGRTSDDANESDDADDAPQYLGADAARQHLEPTTMPAGTTRYDGFRRLFDAAAKPTDTTLEEWIAAHLSDPRIAHEDVMADELSYLPKTRDELKLMNIIVKHSAPQL
jgi:hypothetical protein